MAVSLSQITLGKSPDQTGLAKGNLNVTGSLYVCFPQFNHLIPLLPLLVKDNKCAPLTVPEVGICGICQAGLRPLGDNDIKKKKKKQFP